MDMPRRRAAGVPPHDPIAPVVVDRAARGGAVAGEGGQRLVLESVLVAPLPDLLVLLDSTPPRKDRHGHARSSSSSDRAVGLAHRRQGFDEHLPTRHDRPLDRVDGAIARILHVDRVRCVVHAEGRPLGELPDSRGQHTDRLGVGSVCILGDVPPHIDVVGVGDVSQHHAVRPRGQCRVGITVCTLVGVDDRAVRRTPHHELVAIDHPVGDRELAHHAVRDRVVVGQQSAVFPFDPRTPHEPPVAGEPARAAAVGRADMPTAESVHVRDPAIDGERRECLHAAVGHIMPPTVQQSVGHGHVGICLRPVEYRRKPLRRVARADQHIGVDVVHGTRVSTGACSCCTRCTIAHGVCIDGAVVRQLVECVVIHVRQVVELDRRDRLDLLDRVASGVGVVRGHAVGQ